MDIIFNAHPTNIPEAFQYISVNVLAQLGGVDKGFDDEFAEIYLIKGGTSAG